MCYHLPVIDVREYLDHRGKSPFGDWLQRLESVAAAKVTASILRLAQGNFSNVKGLGGGVVECKIAFGPGYRVYIGRDGETLVILLCGGTKKHQPRMQRRDGRDHKERKKKGLL